MPRRIHDDDLDAARQRRERLGEVRNANGLQRHIDVTLYVGVDRDKIVLTAELQAIAGEVDQGDGIGPGRGNLIEEFAERLAQRRLIEVARAGDGKSRGLQRVGNQTCIVGRRRQRCSAILIVADHQRITHLGGLAGAVIESQRNENDEQRQQCTHK